MRNLARHSVCLKGVLQVCLAYQRAIVPRRHPTMLHLSAGPGVPGVGPAPFAVSVAPCVSAPVLISEQHVVFSTAAARHAPVPAAGGSQHSLRRSAASAAGCSSRDHATRGASQGISKPRGCRASWTGYDGDRADSGGITGMSSLGTFGAQGHSHIGSRVSRRRTSSACRRVPVLSKTC
jgi:hypothetical protein